MTNRNKICKEIDVDLPRQAMCKASVKFIHKHLLHQKCEAIIEQLIILKRKSSIIYVKQPQLSPYHASIDRMVDLYNKLPAEVKLMTMGQFKKYINQNQIKTN